jgi:hypothetical protein
MYGCEEGITERLRCRVQDMTVMGENRSGGGGGVEGGGVTVMMLPTGMAVKGNREMRDKLLGIK